MMARSCAVAVVVRNRGRVIIMANQVDDMSTDPDRGMLEPERASVEPLGSAEPLIRSSATKRSARPASGGNAAKSASKVGPANETSGARTAVLRQGLPRTGAYRASAVTRSLHPTPVATPIVAVTPAETTPVETPASADMVVAEPMSA